MSFPTVIAFSGASGSGKSTLINALASHIDADVIHFDHYVTESSYPDDMLQWLEQGADANQINTPELLRALINARQQSQKPYILLEEPFGKNRRDINPFIDYTCLIETSLEVCLSRVITRHIEQHGDAAISGICNYLQRYNRFLRDCYKTTCDKVRANCDLVVSNTNSLEKTVSQLAHWVEHLHSKGQ